MAEKRLMPVSTLLGQAPAAIAGLSVSGVSADSRNMAPDMLFFGLRQGVRTGDQYLREALTEGAAGAVVEDEQDALDWVDLKPVWRTPHARALLGDALARLHGLSASDLFVAGVTGTNGKSSVTYLLNAVLPQPNFLIGTLGWGQPEQVHAHANTTPDTEVLHNTIAACRRAGARSIAMEVSSHGLALNRIAGVPIQMAVFTNLTRDHLDFHGDMENYFAAKSSLFTRPGLRYAVVNAEDAYAERLLALIPDHVRVLTYGLRQGQLRPDQLQICAEGIRMQFALPEGEVVLQSAWIGRVNAYNLLAAFAAGILLGDESVALAARLGQVAPVPGRLQRIAGPDNAPLVIVDYAHTPDALESVLCGLRDIAPGKLWCVFGCGGDRDPGKRPQMGSIAETQADWVICTDDNPRSESPQAIIQQILAGMEAPEAALCVHDRQRAIQTAIRAARAGDCVLIAGKGHETYQEQGGVRRPFDDAVVASQALEAYGC